LIPAILQNLNSECTANPWNPWCVLTLEKTFYDKRGLDQHFIFISQPLPPPLQLSPPFLPLSPPLFYYLLPRWTPGSDQRMFLSDARSGSVAKLERGIRPLALFTLGRQQSEGDGRHLDAAIRLPPVRFAA
jgi:hypothetical protein